MLAHELVHAAVPEQAGPVRVDIHAVRRTRRLAVEEQAKGNWFSRSGRQHEMRVARVESVMLPPASSSTTRSGPTVHSPSSAQ